MSRKLLIAFTAAVILFAGAYVGSPYWAALQFKEAALSGDVDRLESAVDFPAVRESLKGQLTAAMTEKMASDPEMRSNPFSAFGLALMPVFVGRMIDAFVTPDAIAAMIKQGRAERGKQKTQADPNVRYSYSYRSLDRFDVAVRGVKVSPTEAPHFTFERRGLFAWKLIRLEIPPSALKR